MVTDSTGEVLGRARAAAILVLGSCLAAGAPARTAPEEGAAEEEPSAKPAAKPEPRKTAEKKKTGADLPWVSLEKGLGTVREKYSAAVILHEARRTPLGEAVGEETVPPGFLDGHLGDVSLRDAMKKFVLIRIDPSDLEKPYPLSAKGSGKKTAPEKAREKAPEKDAGAGEKTSPSGEKTVAGRLEIKADVPSLLVLSFREDVVRRFDGELPVPSKLRRELANVWKVNEVHAREARRVEPQIETSRYAYRLGKVREAVQKMLPFEGKESRRLMDAVLDKQVDALLGEYRSKAKEALEEADDLDGESKYEAAIKAFDKAAQDYPFPEIIKTANRRKTDILRKLILR